MGNDEGHKKKEHGENKEGWGIIAFGVEEQQNGWREKSLCTLINNALYNSKGRKGLSLPKRGKENVYLCRNILNWTAHTRHSQKKHWLILFLLKSFQVVHLYTKGSFKDASVCVCVVINNERKGEEGRAKQCETDMQIRALNPAQIEEQSPQNAANSYTMSKK